MIHNSICGSTMIKSNKRNPTALKHGGYSGVTLLPGENPAAFDKLHDELIAEFAPIGRFEEDIVASIAHLVWRKQNLSTYRLAEEAKNRISAIEREWIPPSDIADTYEDPEGYRQARQGADEEARAEFPHGSSPSPTRRGSARRPSSGRRHGRGCGRNRRP